MADIGRNAPCPCGSGKKYKQCHLLPEAAPRRHSAGAESERLTMEILGTVSKADIAAALDLFLGPPDLGGPEQAEPQFFVPWVVYAAPGPDGRTPAERYLARNHARLTARERELLAAEAKAHLSVWEVLEPRPGEGFTARDLLTGDERFVRDVTASKGVTPRSALLGRVVEVDGEGMVSGMHPSILSPQEADDVVSHILMFYKRRKLPLPRELVSGPDTGLLLIHAWRIALLPSPPPKLTNTDGDPVEYVTDRYRLASKDRADILAILGRLERVQRDDDGENPVFVFEVAGNPVHKDWDNTIVGRAEVGRDVMLLDTNSTRRADALKARVEAALGSRVRFDRRETSATDALLAEASEPGRPAPREVPPPEVVEMIQEAKRSHYATWPDSPIPALQGKTPRQSLRTAAGRRRVEALLRQFEFGEAQLPPHERYDVRILREALGLH